MITLESIPTGESYQDLITSKRRDIARRVQYLLYDDFADLEGMDKEALCTVVDPENQLLVRQQMRRLEDADDSTHYMWVMRNDIAMTNHITGVVKVGPHRRGDQKPYGMVQSFAHRAAQSLGIAPEAVGLHAFALESRSRHLATAALRAVYTNSRLVPHTHELRASVDVADDELNEAFDLFHATRSLRDVPIAFGKGFTRRYVQRVLPPKQ